MEDLITLAEAAEFLSVNRATLRNWDRQGILKALRFGSRGDRRYDKSELATFRNSREFHYSPKTDVYEQAAPAHPWFCYPWMIAWTKTTHNPAAKVLTIEYGYFKDSLLKVYYYRKELDAFARDVYAKRAIVSAEWYQHFRLACDQIDSLYQEYRTRNWSALSGEELIYHYQRLMEVYQYFWDYSLFIDSFDAGFDQKKIQEISSDYQLSQEEIICLTSVGELTFSQDYRRELLRLAKRVKNDKVNLTKVLPEFIVRFDWINSNYTTIRHLDSQQIEAELQMLARSEGWDHELGELENAPAKSAAAIQSVLDKHRLSDNPLGFFRQLIWWREERKQYNTMGFHALDMIAQELARRTNLEQSLIYRLSYLEVVQLLAGKLDTQGLQTRRDQGVMFIFSPDRPLVILTSNEATSVHRDLEQNILDQNKQTILSGTVASPGYAQGIARIVNNFHDFDKVEEGDILITSMTRPEFFPIMKKAAAFVTNEGGITCHAAIVAREMGKPCIIGTQIATKVIPDGATVEVRAHHGTVRILGHTE